MRNRRTSSAFLTNDNATIATISVGDAPWGVAVGSDGEYVYVTNSGADTVSVIDTSGNSVIETPEHVCESLLAAAQYLPPTQIMAAPDCGMVKLDSATARAKLHAMAEGARMARQRV